MLSSTVGDFRPFWTHSCFPFEHLLGCWLRASHAKGVGIPLSLFNIFDAIQTQHEIVELLGMFYYIVWWCFLFGYAKFRQLWKKFIIVFFSKADDFPEEYASTMHALKAHMDGYEPQPTRYIPKFILSAIFDTLHDSVFLYTARDLLSDNIT